jgi:hypothetical protein
VDKVERYYKKFAEEGINVVPTAVGFSATDREAHSDRPVLATIGKEVDSLILSGGKPSGSSVSTGSAASTAFATTSTSSTEGGIISRPGDPYRYKVVNDHWLAKRDDQARWYEITGADFKPPFQKSIDILDQENPSLRTSKAPKKSGNSSSSYSTSTSTTTSGNTSTSGEEGSIISVGPGVDPKKQDPKISSEFNFHLIPDGKGTNYRSAQFTEDVMREIYRKYNIKNVVRLNWNGKDAKHLAKHPETSISAEERICKDLGIKFHKLSATREKHQNKVIELLSQGNTLIHCAHGADRTGGNVGGYLYKTKANPAISTTEQIWKYTTQYNGWNRMCIDNPRSFEKGGYLKQAQKFGVKDLADAQRLAR